MLPIAKSYAALNDTIGNNELEGMLQESVVVWCKVIRHSTGRIEEN
jgi:hypothetical protein